MVLGDIGELGYLVVSHVWCNVFNADRKWRGRFHSVQSRDCITHTTNSL